MLGAGRVSDGYEVGSKRARMMESNPYFAVTGGYHQSYGSNHQSYGSNHQSYGSNYGGGQQSSSIYNFPVVRLRGLPYKCTEIDVHKFFVGLDVVDYLPVNKNGLFTGDAFVVFATPMQAEIALQRDRQNMGRRYVEVFKCRKQDYYQAILVEVSAEGGFDRESSPSVRPKKALDSHKDLLEYTEFLKLRGLPYSVTKSDLVDFFQEYDVSEDCVYIEYRHDGKKTGVAFVEFGSADIAKRAMVKDKMNIGSRYVELFPSTPEEANRAKLKSSQLGSSTANTDDDLE